MRSLNVYLAWVFVGGLFGTTVLALPLMLLIMPLAYVFRSLAPIAEHLVLLADAVIVLAVPAVYWYRHGLLPPAAKPGREAGLARGQRLVLVANFLFVFVFPAPFIIGWLQQRDDYFFYVFRTMAVVPLCLILWIAGLILIVRSGQWVRRDRRPVRSPGR